MEAGRQPRPARHAGIRQPQSSGGPEGPPYKSSTSSTRQPM